MWKYGGQHYRCSPETASARQPACITSKSFCLLITQIWVILKSYSNQSTGSMWLLQLNLRDSKSPVGSSNHGIPAEHDALCARRDSENREDRYNVRRVSTVGTSLDWEGCIFCTVSPHSIMYIIYIYSSIIYIAMSSRKRYISEGQYRERVRRRYTEWECAPGWMWTQGQTFFLPRTQ